MVQIEIKPFQHWQEVYDELDLGNPTPLYLSRTYSEWLKEYPDAYTSCDMVLA
jgi:hypothetical protein